MTRLLHILGDKTWTPKLKFLGSTKDIVGRLDYCQARGIQRDELLAKGRGDLQCLHMLRSVDLASYDIVLTEHPRYPKSLAYLRERFPHLRIVIRGHNAEYIHQMDNVRALRLSGYPDAEWCGEQVKKAKESARLRLKFDWICGRIADSVLAISDWEARHYWRWLVGGRKVIAAPYFLPDRYIEQPALPSQERRDACVCLMSVEWNAMAQHAGIEFCRLASGARDRLSGWDMILTGAVVQPDSFRGLDAVRALGVVGNPFDELRSARAMALLSDFGYGFKTKILDAILCGCRVLMPRRLYGRQPEEIRPWCVVVDPLTPEAFAAALEKTREPLPAGDVNRALRLRAFSAMDQALGIELRS